MIYVVNVKGLNKPEQREGIVYVGRAFAGWPAHPLGNPHKGQYALSLYVGWLLKHPDRLRFLTDLWEECEHGAKPLGCWCVPQTWQVERHVELCCHAQCLAVELFKMFAPRHLVSPNVPDGWRCPELDRPADRQVCDLISRDGTIHPGITYRTPGMWLIRGFSPWQGREVGWRPASPALGERST